MRHKSGRRNYLRPCAEKPHGRRQVKQTADMRAGTRTGQRPAIFVSIKKEKSPARPSVRPSGRPLAGWTGQQHSRLPTSNRARPTLPISPGLFTPREKGRPSASDSPAVDLIAQQQQQQRKQQELHNQITLPTNLIPSFILILRGYITIRGWRARNKATGRRCRRRRPPPRPQFPN